MKRWIKYLVLAIAFMVLSICKQDNSEAKNKIYNNGSRIVEYKNKLYYNQSGNEQGVYIYDLKTKKKKKIHGFYQDQIWIAKEKLFYENNRILYSVNVRGGGSKQLYKSDKYFFVLGVNFSQTRIYLQEENKLKELNLNGTVLREQIVTESTNFSGGVFGNTILLNDGTTIYYKNKTKAVKKLANVKKESINEPCMKFLGIFGKYVYGYIYEKPGTSSERFGYIFQISLKTGKVKIEKDLCILNNCLMANGNIYAENIKVSKTICYQLSKKGKIKKKLYNCGDSFGTADKRYIYTRNKCISRFDTKTKKCKILDNRYKKKKSFYYGSPNYPDSSMNIINGKLFFTVHDCSSGKMMGWRLLADCYMEYYISLKKGKVVNYAKSKS